MSSKMDNLDEVISLGLKAHAIAARDGRLQGGQNSWERGVQNEKYVTR